LTGGRLSQIKEAPQFRAEYARAQVRPAEPDVPKFLKALLPALAFSAPALAAPADPDNGAMLARHWCASCHIIAEDQARGADNVSTFAAIANKPGFDAAALSRFLRDPHPKMPDMQLSKSESADLAAYIASLKK
jgi:mono/diheme cytochrome c family protein